MTEQFGHVGDKVLTYSVLRLAIISAYSGNLKKMITKTAEGHYTYSCNLVNKYLFNKFESSSIVLDFWRQKRTIFNSRVVKLLCMQHIKVGCGFLHRALCRDDIVPMI